MTTHDEPTNITSTSTNDVDSAPEFSSTETEQSAAEPDQPVAAEPSAAEPDQPAAAERSAPTESEGMEGETSVAESEPSTAKSMFPDDLSGLRSRWDDVQAAFVDSPKECVEKADALVAEVVEQVTRGFSEVRSRLEAQWARGEEASTEDLRLSLKRYREFFQRLLSV
jgi:hypothetical protein